MSMSLKQFGFGGMGLWRDPVDKHLVLSVVRKLSNPRDQKGISGLIGDFQRNGLGEKIAAWMDPDRQNETVVGIGPDDIEKVLGKAFITTLAAEVKESDDDVSSRLAWIVPRLVNQVLVAGEVPSKDVEMVGLEAIRSNILNRAV